VFHDADPVRGVIVDGPHKVRGNLVRLDVRRLFADRRLGVNPTLTYDNSSKVKTTDVAAYYRLTSSPDRPASLYAGVRIGYQTEQAGQGGAFASVFVAPVFRLGR